MWHAGWGFGFWWIFPLFFGLAWLALFAFVIFRLRGAGRCGAWGPWGPRAHWGAHGPWGSDPLDVLRDRFARGEIDAEEYEKRRHVLEGR